MKLQIPVFVNLLVLILLSSSCKKDNIVIEEDTTSLLHDNVHVITDELAVFLLERRSTSLKFSDQDPIFETIKAGDIIVSNGDNNLSPNGYLRKITSIEYEKNGVYTFYTVSASLIDLIKNGVIEEIPFPKDTPPWSFTYPIPSTTLYDADDDPSTDNDLITIDGQLNIQFSAERFYLDVRNETVKFSIEPKVTTSNDLNVHIGVTTGLISDKEVIIGKKPLPTIWVPVANFGAIPMTPSLKLSAGMFGDVNLTEDLNFRVDGTYKSKLFFDKIWDFIESEENSLEFNNTTDFSANAELEVYLKASVELDFYKEVFFGEDLAELSLYAKTYLRAKFDSNEPNACHYSLGVRLGAEAGFLFIENPYVKDDLADFPYSLCGEAEEDGEFIIYEGLGNGNFSDITVSQDGTQVWTFDVDNLYKWNESSDDFSEINFKSAFEDQYGVIGSISNLAINPLTNELYLSLTTPKGIYKKSGENYLLITNEANSSLFSEMHFDAEGNLWFIDPFYDNLKSTVFQLKTDNQLVERYSINTLICTKCLSKSFQDGRIIINDTFGKILAFDSNGNYEILLNSSGNFVSSTIQANNGDLWGGDVLNSIIYHYNAQSGNVLEYSSSEIDDIITGFISTPSNEIYFIPQNTGILPDSPIPQLLKWVDGNEFISLNSNNSNLPDFYIDNDSSHFFTDIEYSSSKNYIWLTYGDYILRHTP